MKFVKEMKTYCPKCNKHTVHTVSIYKAGKQRATADRRKKARGRYSWLWWSKVPQTCTHGKNDQETGFEAKVQGMRQVRIKTGNKAAKARRSNSKSD